jgi:hypothetical protein
VVPFTVFTLTQQKLASLKVPEIFPIIWVKKLWGMKLATQLCTVPRLRMNGAILYSPDMPSWYSQGMHLYSVISTATVNRLDI